MPKTLKQRWAVLDKTEAEKEAAERAEQERQYARTQLVCACPHRRGGGALYLVCCTNPNRVHTNTLTNGTTYAHCIGDRCLEIFPEAKGRSVGNC